QVPRGNGLEPAGAAEGGQELAGTRPGGVIMVGLGERRDGAGAEIRHPLRQLDVAVLEIRSDQGRVRHRGPPAGAADRAALAWPAGRGALPALPRPTHPAPRPPAPALRRTAARASPGTPRTLRGSWDPACTPPGPASPRRGRF